MGLDSMEHWYGLPSLFTDRTIQDYPVDYNYADEQWRCPKWNEVLEELVDLDFTLVPTFTIYEANRDVMRAGCRRPVYAAGTAENSFMPDPRLHGSYHFDWTTADEVAWRQAFDHAVRQRF